MALRIDLVSPCLSPRRRQPLLPVGEGFLCWPRLCGAVVHRREFLVVTGLAGRNGRQPPRMQEPLQLPVAERIMCGVYSLPILAEELGAFAHGEVPEDGLRVIRIINPNRLGEHATQATAGAWTLPASHASADRPPPGHYSTQRFNELFRTANAEEPRIIIRHGREIAVVTTSPPTGTCSLPVEYERWLAARAQRA